MKITCSSGTYIRSLCRDLAEALGTYGYVSYLLRTQAGPYQIRDAVTLEQLEFRWRDNTHGLIRPADEPLLHLPAINLPPADERKIRDGVRIAVKGLPPDKGTVRVYGSLGFMGTGIMHENGNRIYLKMKTMLERRES